MGLLLKSSCIYGRILVHLGRYVFGNVYHRQNIRSNSKQESYQSDVSEDEEFRRYTKSQQ